MKRYNRNRRDGNESPLIAHAKALGADWWEDGPLDGWLIKSGVWMPVEIKRPEREGMSDEYTPQQLKFFRWCSERRAKWLTWRTLTDVESSLGARRTA
jgi:hypothetical protein